MPIVLDVKETPFTQKFGADVLELVAGKHLKVETSPDGAEILDAIVPVGKVWNVTIIVNVEERNA